MDLIWTYEFEDGTKYYLINQGFTGEELLIMVKNHGKVLIGAKNAKIELYERNIS